MTNAKAITKSLMEHPDEWTCDGYKLRHKPTGLQLWTANGWPDLETYQSPLQAHLGCRDRWKVFRAFKRWHQTFLEKRLFSGASE